MQASVPAVNPGRWLIVLSLLAVYFIWGSTYFAIRFVVTDFPPFMAGALRFISAGGLLYLMLKAQGGASPTRQEWRGATIIGALLMGGGMGGVMMAQSLGAASSLSAIFPAATPLLVSLFAGLWGEWPRKAEWLGLLVGFGGVILLSLEGSLRSNLGATLLLALAPISWSLGTAWSRHLKLPKGLMASAAEMLSGGLVLLCLSLLFGERMNAVPSWSSVMALLYLTVFGSLIAYSAFVYLIHTVRPALATSYAYINPVIAVVLGVGLASEQLSLSSFVALPIILIGVGLVTTARDPRSKSR
jgi:drug/metabolite transporter (DMT)-like permease